MQIFTLEHEDFGRLLDAITTARAVGHYWREGKVLTVFATHRFVLISTPDNRTRIGVKPARSEQEARQIATRLLRKEEERGNRVEFIEVAG